MDSPLKNEETTLVLIDTEEHVIAKSFFTDFKISQPILHSMLENRSAGKIFRQIHQLRRVGIRD